MPSTIPSARVPVRYALAALAGVLFAIIVHRLWSLEKTSHFLVIVAAIATLGFSALFLRRLPDLLLLVFLCLVPITGFFKTLFLLTARYSDTITAVLLTSGGVIGVGPLDIALALLYAVWLYQIFVTRKEAPPRWMWSDTLVALLMLAYLLSLINAPEKKAGWFSIIYQVRYVLAYVYISRRIEWRHMSWVVPGILVLVFLELALATYQFGTGRLTNLILDRGSGADLHSQYEVPGIEHRNRASGTCNESHTFGLFMALLGQWLLVASLNRSYSVPFRLLLAAGFVAAMVALLLSFSRSAWLSAAITIVIVWAVHLAWGERESVFPVLIALLVGLILLPWAITIVIERFSTAEGIVSARFEQFPVAWQIWKDHFLFGYGVGNYMWALETYNRQGVLELPVHNVFLWIGAEMGLVGVIAYFSLAGAMLFHALKYVRRYPHPVSRLALIVAACLIATLLDGLTDPLYREPVVYMMFWLSLGLGAALDRLAQTAPDV